MKNHRYFYCIFLILINQIKLFSQTNEVSLTSKDEKKIASDENIKSIVQSVNPALNTGVISSQASINLTSIFSDTRASVKFSFNAGRGLLNLGFSQSFSEKPKVSTLIDLDGLTSGSTLSVGWQMKIGKDLIPDKVPIKDIAKFEKVKKEFRNKKENKDLFPESLDVTFLDLNDEYKKKMIESGALNLGAFATPWLLSVQFNVSKVGFDYIADSSSLKPIFEQKLNKNLTFSFSKFKNLDTYFSLSYSLLLNNQSGENIINYSFPIGNNGLLYSKDVTIGTPKEKVDSKFKAEMRQLIRNKNNVPILGINPSIAFLAKREKINIDFPVYFLTKNDKEEFNGLQAGFKIGYTSKLDTFINDFLNFNSDKMYFSLFITQPFSLRN